VNESLDDHVNFYLALVLMLDHLWWGDTATAMLMGLRMSDFVFGMAALMVMAHASRYAVTAGGGGP
jgi:hypothetical protein